MDLARFIAWARDRQGLSLRRLEKRAEDLNHAYIWRLEKGDRETPSTATVSKLSKALDLNEREQEIFLLLVKTDIDDALYQLMMDRPDIRIADIEPVATMSFRGNRPSSERDWLNLIDMVRGF